MSIYYFGDLQVVVMGHVMIIYSNFIQVAILDGITMGGGAGISLLGMFRLVSDKTVCDCS